MYRGVLSKGAFVAANVGAPRRRMLSTGAYCLGFEGIEGHNDCLHGKVYQFDEEITVQLPEQEINIERAFLQRKLKDKHDEADDEETIKRTISRSMH